MTARSLKVYSKPKLGGFVVKTPVGPVEAGPFPTKDEAYAERDRIRSERPLEFAQPKSDAVHAAAFVKTVGGEWMQFHTLCGFNVQATPVSTTDDAAKVTCKACLRSRGWEALLLNLASYHAQNETA